MIGSIFRALELCLLGAMIWRHASLYPCEARRLATLAFAPASGSNCTISAICLQRAWKE